MKQLQQCAMFFQMNNSSVIDQLFVLVTSWKPQGHVQLVEADKWVKQHQDLWQDNLYRMSFIQTQQAAFFFFNQA